MKKASVALGLAVTLALSFGLGIAPGPALAQGVPAEARRHFEAGMAAVEAAKSPAGYAAAIREFEAAARLLLGDLP